MLAKKKKILTPPFYYHIFLGHSRENFLIQLKHIERL
jgi:hypothetical protein